MRSLTEALASYPRAVIPGRPPGQCRPCRTYHHHECLGPPRCTCAWCHGRQVIASGWETFDTSNSVQSLRIALGKALTMADQKQTRREVVWWSNPEPAGICLCGCGQTVIASRFGRRRRYVSNVHRQRAYDRRVARERQAAALWNLAVG